MNIESMPKAELHVHLEGSIRPETVLALARRHHIDLPSDTLEGLKQWFNFTHFEHFIEVYLAITRCLRTTEDYELITYEFGAEMARQNTKYAEVTFSPCTHESMGMPQEVWFPGLTRGRKRAKEAFGVEINWIFDIVRIERNRAWNGDYTLAVALEGREEGVVALGLGGYEAPNPPGAFARWFKKAKDGGLKSAPHAGETAGPESIWSAIRDLQADRIGHGVRAIEDPELVSYLAQTGLPLEVCPTSNLCLGVYRSIEEHPLRRLHDAGVIVTINSDDPPLFGTSLTDEIRLLDSAFGFSPKEVEGFMVRAVECSFLPEVRKQSLGRSFREETRSLRGNDR